MTSPPPAKKAKVVRAESSTLLRMSSDTVVVLVGEWEARFVVHRNLITSSSDFFKKAVEGDFKEKHDGVVKLRGTKKTTFELYTSWLCTRRLSVADKIVCLTPQNLAHRNNSMGDKKKEKLIAELARVNECLVLSDMIQDDVFYNATIDCFVESLIAEETYPTGMAALLGTKLPATSPVFKLLIDVWVFCGGESWFTGSDIEDAPRSFWPAVAQGLIKKNVSPTTTRPWTIDRCQYHKHREGGPKCS